MEPFIDIGAVAQIFGISRSQAYRMKKAQAWPHHLFGTEIRFSQEDIKAIAELNHKTPPPPKTRPNVGTRARRNQQ
jgi:predicted DNA-binding transcriptional regulator AlpA